MSEVTNYSKIPTDNYNGVAESSVSSVPPTAIKGDDPRSRKEEKVKTVGFFALFRFTDNLDKGLIALGLLCATINGAGLPVWVILFGEMTKMFTDTGAFMEFLQTIPEFIQANNRSGVFYITNPEKFDCIKMYEFYGGNMSCYAHIPHTTVMDEMASYAIYFCVIGGVIFFAAYGQVVCWMTAAERQAHRIRHACLFNVLRQDIGWFDTHAATELNTRLADDVQKIQSGIGDKVATFWQWFSCSVFSLIIGFLYGWKLALVILAASPALVITASLFGKLATSISSKSLAAYARAGNVAEEVFGCIRTVVAFGGQEKEAKRYRKHLSEAEAVGIRKGLTNGISFGLMWLAVFSMYGLSYWYGAKLYREDDDYDAGDVVAVTFAVLIAAYGLGMAAPSIEVIATGRGAAFTVFDLINTKSAIDSSSETGFKPTNVNGRLKLVDVHFKYPSRPDVKVLDGVSMEAKPGQTVALVGASGCGKSTIVQLLLRFYDAQQGKVMIDGRDIKEFNVKWLRQNIGFVSQEPVLFATTIAENIRYGKEDVTMEEIIEASKDANAADFIRDLPDQFDTLVGERGCQLSGGQKQRLAIARALVRDPKILLLDEATSALDTESESIVQDALDNAREGRTTIIIAHRLSTIKNADIIIGLKEGRVEEVGTHDELMSKQGYYYQLVMHQQADTSDEDLEEDVAEEDKMANMATTNGRLPVDTVTHKKDKEDLPDAPFTRLMKLNAPEWPCIVIGCLASILNGCVWPAFGIILGSVMTVFTINDLDKQKREVEKYALLFLMLAVGSFITQLLQCYLFGRSGEALTKRLRDMSFQSMMRQEIAWFDDHGNNVGALTTRLATDAALVQGVIGQRLGNIVMNLANLFGTLVVSFIHGWKMTLLLIVMFPILSIGGIMNVKVLSGQTRKNKDALEQAGKITVESIGNIRTVASLTIEPKFVDLYMKNLEAPLRVALKNSHIVALMFGLSQCVIYTAYAVSFSFGAFMIEEGEMDFRDVMIVFSSVLFGFIGVGHASAIAPDIGKAQTSAKHMIKIIDSEPIIDHTSDDGEKLKEGYEAQVTFKDVCFSYPTRPTVTVLQGLTVMVSPGQTLALVGTSGCGKSTALQLIERFYDCISGLVALDNQDVRSLNIKWLREQIGIVSQEPVLFDTSIAENIAYGDNTRTVPKDEIVAAARHANIHSFIAALPEGYETNVGSKGTQLSGGQKQRIAIARALVRNPKVLLLDEATSALDTESEKIVQEALDKAREGRTCIVIAHRLSTVKNADRICVINHGKLVESGNHSELMAQQGIYYKLVKKSIKEL